MTEDRNSEYKVLNELESSPVRQYFFKEIFMLDNLVNISEVQENGKVAVMVLYSDLGATLLKGGAWMRRVLPTEVESTVKELTEYLSKKASAHSPSCKASDLLKPL